ncbi:E3 ubiquitin-protein ligase APD1-4 [Theobroma cacao]|nr:E3 ubiquitin-protein ligase APD1-4 [Theobroma cacao]
MSLPSDLLLLATSLSRSLSRYPQSKHVQARALTGFQQCSTSTVARDLGTTASSFDFMDIVSKPPIWLLCGLPYGAWAKLFSIDEGYFSVEVRDDNGKGALLFGFSEKPELNGETNWSSSNYLIVGSYGRKGYYLWLNKGSRICIRWATQTSRLDKIEVLMMKGERKRETLLPNLSTSFDALFLNESMNGKEAEYTIEEDDKYYVSVVSSNPRSIIMTFSLNVTSKVYDLTKASNMCSTLNGSCRLKLLFPDTQYVIVSTPDNGDLAGSYIELSFVARVITYIAILGFFIIIIFLVLKYLGACDTETTVVDTAVREISWRTETEPILPEKTVHLTYGTTAEEDNDDAETGSSSSSSEDLYDAKLCVICYDDQRNCFFVPCGHCATCYDCAQRIMEEDNKMCPICRRLIHKARRLFSP